MSFQCTKCWKYSPKVKCFECFPSKCFPLPCEKYPPKDYEGYKKWDGWYVWRYLLEPAEDYEEIYQVGASEITERVKQVIMIEKMKAKAEKAKEKRKHRFKYVAHISLNMSSECKAFKYRFAKKAKYN